MRPSRPIVVATLVLLQSPPSAHAQLTPTSEEFLVDTHTTGRQFSPRVCARDAGDFVATWTDGSVTLDERGDGLDGYETGVLARRFRGPFFSSPPEVVVNSYTIGRQSPASIACLEGGAFVVVWNEREAVYPPTPPLGRRGLFARRYDANGTPGAEVTLQVDEPPFDCETCLPNGATCRGPGAGFIVVWGLPGNAIVRRFDAESSTIGEDVHVPGLYQPKCCGGDAGFVVVGTRLGDIFAQRFSTDGSLAGSEFMVNTATVGSQYSSVVACNDAGSFVVVWESRGVGAISGVRGRLLEADGGVGTEFEVTRSGSLNTSVAMDGSGRFVVAWDSYGAYRDAYEVHARGFDAAGAPLGPALQLDTRVHDYSRSPAVGMSSRGDIVVAWSSWSQFYDWEWDVAARRYALHTPSSTTTSLPLPSCGDPVMYGGDITATDALYTLQAGVGAVTCDPCLCDIDGNGAIVATDSLFLLSYISGAPVSLACPPC